MKIFRNAEIAGAGIVHFLLLLIAIIVGGLIGENARCLAVCLVVVGAFCHFVEVQRRYQVLEEMTRELDLVLHQRKRLELSRFQEGELSLLSNEIGKMWIRLEEQADKQYLVDFIADISHQIRTPLTAINLHLEALKQENMEPSELKKHTREIRRLENRIEWLVESLLKMARLDTGTILFQRELVDMEALLKKALEPQKILMELKGQKLEWNVQGRIMGDFSWTQEAVGNIIKNCVEHMEEGTLFIIGRENSIYSEIVVRDTGKGLDEKDLYRIFERFYKGKNASKESVGIGLALARQIVTGEGGTITAQNHPQGGAMFTIRFYKSKI